MDRPYDPRYILRTTAIVLAMVVVLVVIWAAAGVIFIVFGGLVAASIFHYAARGLCAVLPLPRRLALLAVYVIAAGLIAGGLYWGGATIVSQFGALWDAISGELDKWNGLLSDMGYKSFADAGASIKSFLPNPASIFSSARTAVSIVLGGLGNIFVIIFVGVFVSWQPGVYRRGYLSLFPKDRRQRLDEVTVEAAERLGWWMLGQAGSMLTIFAASWLILSLIGMPYALLLALQAGLLAFIPTVGPFLAGLPMILTGLTVSPTMALWGAGAYAAIQLLESNISQPIIQRETTSLPPALTLGVQLLFGALFGIGGLLVAVPMLAVVLTFVQCLYIEDTLGGGVKRGGLGG